MNSYLTNTHTHLYFSPTIFVICQETFYLKIPSVWHNCHYLNKAGWMLYLVLSLCWNIFKTETCTVHVNITCTIIHKELFLTILMLANQSASWLFSISCMGAHTFTRIQWRHNEIHIPSLNSFERYRIKNNVEKYFYCIIFRLILFKRKETSIHLRIISYQSGIRYAFKTFTIRNRLKRKYILSNIKNETLCTYITQKLIIGTFSCFRVHVAVRTAV